ncbi:hypothetical protein BS47DRAFT_1364651 [Hydnum rufescens UP504]|uniref:Uncharacterized protein n=1 Tax=Hydnum rufescens UP504 TaxID=1448309 RepID=A0A9P6AT39_9AGAM|nr:hypothetical protein BS47DRAFT_1364651 [Hydnum rufescens UP504]
MPIYARTLRESEASEIRSVFSPAFKFKGEGVTLCDAGGATVDLATYNVLRASGAPKLAEAAPRSGSCTGSLFLDLHFLQLVQERLAAHPVHLDEASLAHFMWSFLQSEKLDHKGAEDDIKLFRFRCLHDEYLVIFGDVLRRVFDPAVEQMQASKVRLDILLLVGGFSTNEYLFQRITNVFRRIALPTELEDRTMRPAYITSVVGSSFCEHRVEYIVRSGTSVMKGNKNELRVRKIYRTLDIVLYASNVEESKRSFDGEDEELCRCRIDLEMYPSLLEQAEASPFGNFYVDFVLGFEMDTVEIRCVLLYNGMKCGSVTCHPRRRHLSPPL